MAIGVGATEEGGCTFEFDELMSNPFPIAIGVGATAEGGCALEPDDALLISKPFPMGIGVGVTADGGLGVPSLIKRPFPMGSEPLLDAPPVLLEGAPTELDLDAAGMVLEI